MIAFRAALLLLLSFAAISTAAPSAGLENSKRGSQCYTNGPFMLIAHGTGESGKGACGYVTSAFADQVPGAGSTGFQYPADMNNYTHSETTGVHDMKRHIKNYINQCGKNSKIMLLGYSQGANVVSDVLGGGTFYGGSRSGNGHSMPLKQKWAKHIVGVLLFGDPAFTAGQSYDAGTSTHDGVLPRNEEQLAHLSKYANMMKSYCDKNDPYCASGKKTNANLKIHGEYFEKYTDEATSWLLRQWDSVK